MFYKYLEDLRDCCQITHEEYNHYKNGNFTEEDLKYLTEEELSEFNKEEDEGKAEMLYYHDIFCLHGKYAMLNYKKLDDEMASSIIKNVFEKRSDIK
jgi:hypothetical protein